MKNTASRRIAPFALWLGWVAGAFAQDVRVYTPQMTEDHMTSVAMSAPVAPTLSGDAALALDPGAPLAPFVIGTTPGRAVPFIPSHNLYAYCISDAAAPGPKSNVVVMTGNHNTETSGSHAFQGFIDFILSAAPEAVALRAAADFHVYPLVNPDGRYTMSGRANAEMAAEGFGNDHNRVWNTLGLDLSTIDAIGAAILNDTGRRADYFFDFHGAQSDDFFYVDRDLLGHPFGQAMAARAPQAPERLINPDHRGTSVAWARSQSGLNAGYAIVPENSFNFDVAGYNQLGAAYALALYDVISAGLDPTPGTPFPRDGAGFVDPLTAMSWHSHAADAAFDVYLGADENQVGAATTASPLYLGRGTSSFIDASPLDFNADHFWRVDAIVGAAVHPGPVWSFTTTLPRPDTQALNCWPLDGSAIDVLGSSHGQLFGALPTDDRRGAPGGALLFDGADDYALIPDIDYNAGAAEFTLALWFKIGDVSAGSVFQYIYSHGVAGAPRSLAVYMVEPNGTMRTYLVLDNGASLNITTSRTLDDDQWHQYVLTVSPLLGAAVYLDGQRHQGNTGFGPGSLDPPGELYIGARSDLDPDRYFGDSASGGSIDEVCVYQGALTAETIAALYEAGVSLRTAVRPPHWTRYDR